MISHQHVLLVASSTACNLLMRLFTLSWLNSFLLFLLLFLLPSTLQRLLQSGQRSPARPLLLPLLPAAHPAVVPERRRRLGLAPGRLRESVSGRTAGRPLAPAAPRDQGQSQEGATFLLVAHFYTGLINFVLAPCVPLVSFLKIAQQILPSSFPGKMTGLQPNKQQTWHKTNQAKCHNSPACYCVAVNSNHLNTFWKHV